MPRNGIAGPALVDTANWLFMIVIPIYTPTTKYFKTLFECIVYVILVLICMSLKISEAEHLSIYVWQFRYLPLQSAYTSLLFIFYWVFFLKNSYSLEVNPT